MTERFYSGERDGVVSFRDGVRDGIRRPLQCLYDHQKHAAGRAGEASNHAPLALALLADALDDEQRALEVHEYFTRRVISLLPPRFTISRSRVLAYVAMIEHEKRAGLFKD